MKLTNYIRNILLITLTSVSLFLHAEQAVQELPMYAGADRSKNPELLARDNDLIAKATRTFGTREHASEGYVERGFDDFSNNEFKHSMERFNQAWLLNPENAYAYLGFGLLMNQENNSCEAYKMFKLANEKGLKENGFLADYAYTTTQCALLKENDDKKKLFNSSNELYETALQTSNKRLLAYIYHSWAKSYFLQKDIARSKEMVEQSKNLGGKIDSSLLNDLNSES